MGERVRLPALPAVAERIHSMSGDPNVSVLEVAAVVAQEPAITTKVLRIANSAYYGLMNPAISVEQAASVVGLRNLSNIALQASVVHQFEHLQREAHFDLEEFWAHATLTARLSQALARRIPIPAPVTPEEFYTCGLLHDIGKLVEMDSMHEEYVDVLGRAHSSGEAIHLVEERVLGFTHIDVGALLAARWKLPEPVAHAIQFHHGPKCEILANPTTAVVAFCDQIAYRLATPSFEGALPRLAELAEQALRMPAAEFEAFARSAHEVGTLVEV